MWLHRTEQCVKKQRPPRRSDFSGRLAGQLLRGTIGWAVTCSVLHCFVTLDNCLLWGRESFRISQVTVQCFENRRTLTSVFRLPMSHRVSDDTNNLQGMSNRERVKLLTDTIVCCKEFERGMCVQL